MQFRVDQRFDATVADVMALYTDPDFYASLVGLPKIGTPEVTSLERDGERVRMKIRYRFTGHLPAAALAVLDPEKLTWVEDATYNMNTGAISSKLLPDHYADRMVASARGTVAEVQSDPPRSARKIQGDVAIRMPFVGGQVEKAIVSGLREHLGDEEQAAARWLRGDRT